MKAVSKECREINGRFEQAKSFLSQITQGLPPAEELTAKTAEAKQTLEDFSQLVKEHSQKMDIFLQMLKSVI